MVTTIHGQAIETVDRRTRAILVETCKASEAFAQVTAKAAQTCADGILTDTERHALRVELLHLDSHLSELKRIVG